MPSPATNTRMKPIVRGLRSVRGSSGLATVKATPLIAVRASMRRRSPAPAVVRQRWAVNSVRHGVVLSLSTTTLPFERFLRPVTVALSVWMPILRSFDGVIADFHVRPRLAFSLRPSSL